MRLVEILQLIAALAGTLVSIYAGLEKRLLKRFRKAGATSPGDTLEIGRLNPIFRWRFNRLLKTGVIININDEYYLDNHRWRELRKKRRIRGLTILSIVVAGVALYLLIQYL